MPAPHAMPLHRFCQAFHTVHLCAMTLGTLSLKLPWQMMLETLQSQQSYPSETRLFKHGVLLAYRSGVEFARVPKRKPLGA